MPAAPVTLEQRVEDHQSLLEQLKEKGEQLLQRVESFALSHTNITEKLAEFEQKFLPVTTWSQFRTELDDSLSKWSQGAVASLEEMARAAVKHELELFVARTSTTQAATAAPAPEEPATTDFAGLSIAEPIQEPPPTKPGLPHPIERDVFPTLEEYTAEGFFPTSYAGAKALWEQRHSATAAEGVAQTPEENAPPAAATGAGTESA